MKTIPICFNKLPVASNPYVPFRSIGGRGYAKYRGNIIPLDIQKTTKLAASAWWKANSTGSDGNQYLFTKFDNQVNGGYYVYNNSSTGLQPYWALRDTGGTEIGIYLTNAIVANTWTNVCLYADGTGLRSGLSMWINGAVATVTTFGSVALVLDINAGKDFTIGALSNNNGNSYIGYNNGKINNLAMFTGYTFTTTDALAQYNSGVHSVDQSIQTAYSNCTNWWQLASSADTTGAFIDTKGNWNSTGVSLTLETDVP